MKEQQKITAGGFWGLHRIQWGKIDKRNENGGVNKTNSTIEKKHTRNDVYDCVCVPDEVHA